MAEKPISTPLPADLPEDWTYGQTVAPAGSDVGLSQQHGYNYLMSQVNAAQQAVNTMNNAFEGLPSLGEGGTIPEDEIPELPYIPSSEKGTANGVASLDSSGKVPSSQLPDMDYIPTSQKGAAGGVASLGSDGKVPAGQLPEMDYDPAGSAAAVQANLTSHINDQDNPHDVTAGQVGAYTKEEVLSDETAQMYGFTEEQLPGVVPDDVLAFLGKYAQYWWKREKIGYIEKQSPMPRTTITSVTSMPPTKTLSHSQNIIIDQSTGDLSLDNPSTLSFDYLDGEDIVALAPCYFTVDSGALNGVIVYIPENSTFSESSDYTSATIVRNGNTLYIGTPEDNAAVQVTTEIDYSDLEYIQSPNRYAYPDSGKQDGYEYQYIGMPLDNAVTAPKIATGSYVGTGTYGEDNPNSLTFEFNPKILWIYGVAYSSTIQMCDLVMVKGLPITTSKTLSYMIGNDTERFIQGVSFDGDTVSWYSSTEFNQQNYSGYTYYYIAIG